MIVPQSAPPNRAAVALLDFVIGMERLMPAHHPGSEMAAYRYPNMESLVLDRGVFWSSERLTDDEATLVWQAIVGGPNAPLVPKACYANCQEIVLQDKSGQLAYCEGYALSLVPVWHAWLDLDGKLIDPTWPVGPDEAGYGSISDFAALRRRAGGRFPDERAYLGLRFTDRAAIAAHRAANQSCICLIDDWPNRWPLLKDPSLYGAEASSAV